MYKPEDFVHQLAEHIKKNLKKGYTVDALKFSLMNQGYSRISVEKAIDLANKKLAEEAPLMKEKPQITYRVVEDNQTVEIPIKKNFSHFFKKIFRK